MFEIKGKVNTAFCYAKVIEDEAVDQVRRMCDYRIHPGLQNCNYARCSCGERLYYRDNNDN